MIGHRGHIFAITLAARAPAEWQTRDDISHVLDAFLRSHHRASQPPPATGRVWAQTRRRNRDVNSKWPRCDGATWLLPRTVGPVDQKLGQALS